MENMLFAEGYIKRGDSQRPRRAKVCSEVRIGLHAREAHLKRKGLAGAELSSEVM